MKTISKKLGAIVLALAMCFSLCCVAFAAEGDYTITVNNSLGGQTYSAYKIFDAAADESGNGISYSINADSAWLSVIQESNYFTLTPYEYDATDTDVVTVYHVEAVAGVSGADIAAYLVENIPTGATADATSVGDGKSIDLNVSGAGYYLVTGVADEEGAVVVGLTTVNPSVSINDKSQRPGEGGNDPTDPTWEGGFTKDADEGSYSVGDTIDYVIRSYAPTYDGDDVVTEYKFTDTMGAGLTMIETDENEDGVLVVTSGVKVEIISSSAEASSATWTDITENCTITIVKNADGSEILTVDYTIADINGYPADAVVKISYTDYVNENADDTDLTNEVSMIWYKYNPEDVPEGEDPDPQPDPDDGKKTDENVYTYGFGLEKTDGTNPLAGAEFTLADSNGLIQFVKVEDSNGDTVYEVYDNHETTNETSSTISVDSDDAYVEIWGLGAGTYTLTETKAPDGYNLLTDSVTIIIEATEDGWSVTVGDDTVNGSITVTRDDDGEIIFTTVTMPDAITIVNNAGSELPGTGGMGTTIFYIIGGVLVAGAAVVLITRRRMSSES